MRGKIERATPELNSEFAPSLMVTDLSEQHEALHVVGSEGERDGQVLCSGLPRLSPRRRNCLVEVPVRKIDDAQERAEVAFARWALPRQSGQPASAHGAGHHRRNGPVSILAEARWMCVHGSERPGSCTLITFSPADLHSSIHRSARARSGWTWAL